MLRLTHSVPLWPFSPIPRGSLPGVSIDERGGILAPSLVDRRFLITGGTGSFGQTMVRRLLAAGAAEIRVFSRDEAKQDDMRRRLGDDRVRFYVCLLYTSPSPRDS